MSDELHPLHNQGLMPKRQYARLVKRHPRTLDRWEAAGKLVMRRQGSEDLVDVPATADRLRGLDRPRRGKPRAA
jgi:hypothetical protein